MSATAEKFERREPENRTGFCRLRRRMPETDPKTQLRTTDVQWNYERLIARAGPLGAWLIVYIIDRTSSSYRGENVPPPEYARLELQAVSDFLYVSGRQVRNVIKFLSAPERRLISRHPEDAWMYRAHPENFEAAPLIQQVRRPHKRRGAALSATGARVNLRNEAHFQEDQSGPDQRRTQSDSDLQSELKSIPPQTPQNEMQFSNTHGDNGPLNSISEPPQPISNSMQHISKEEKCAVHPTGMEFGGPETHCPFDWGCPFTINGLAEDKPLTLITPKGRPASGCDPDNPDDVPSVVEARIAHMLCESEVSWLFQNQTPGPKLLEDIRINLQGASVERLQHRIWQRHRSGYEFESMGLVKPLAKEVGDRWKLDEAARRDQEEQERVGHLSKLRDEVFDLRHRLHVAWQELQSVNASFGRRLTGLSGTITLPSECALTVT